MSSRQRACSLLARLQLGLEALYRVETQLAIDAFLIDGEQRDEMGPARGPREQLLLREADGELGMALFVDSAALANLEQNDPAARLDDENFGDFCLAVEGVSHFVYVALRAAASRPVSQLELELQAEVDKFVLLVLEQLPYDRGEAFEVHSRLFERVTYLHEAGTELGDRYRTANDLAARFVRRLLAYGPETTHATLRRFYRAGQTDKIRLVAA
jgi:hypothetical protein